MDRSDLIPMLVLWMAVIGVLVLQVSRKPSAGLVAAYCFQMWLLHWFGALVHSFPWSELPSPEVVALGFGQATYGIVSFAVGVLILGPIVGRRLLKLGNAAVYSPDLETGTPIVTDAKMGRLYIISGIISYFILAPTIGQYPGLQAIPAVASQLVIVGCCLQCWTVWHRSGILGLARTLVPTLLIPLVILMKQGFLGFGVIAVSIILAFTAQFFRPRWILVVGFVLGAYMGMTVYVSYMRDRFDIRVTVWGGAAISDRLDQAWKTATTLDRFDPTDSQQLAVVDDRLNQNLLIGAAVDNLSRNGGYANGATIWEAAMGMVPRLLWPTKPVGAGSHGLVTSFTGMDFADSTSVGIGPVLEFYANFGTAGVLIGFFILGGLIGGLDLCAGTHLRTGNYPYFMTAFLIGISFMNVSGSLVEISAGSMASVAVAYMVRRMIKRRATTPEYESQQQIEAVAH